MLLKDRQQIKITLKNIEQTMNKQILSQIEYAKIPWSACIQIDNSIWENIIQQTTHEIKKST